MRFIRHKASIEPLISRIPTLFPYMSWDANGNAVILSASNSVDGSYGKIVPDIRIPCNATFCIYSVTDDTASSRYWDEYPDATYGKDSVVPVYADELGMLYIRHTDGYGYSINNTPEDPSLYVEKDTLPVIITEESEPFIKLQMLDPYGNPINDCDGNPAFKYYDKGTEYTYYKKDCIIKGGECYSYNSVMSVYNRYKDYAPQNNGFIRFVTRAIGLVSTDRKYLGLSDKKKYPLVPSHVYLSECEDLYHKYLDISRRCAGYNTLSDSDKAVSKELCCECERYEQMGGDRFMEYLKGLIPRRDSIASEYKCVADNGECGGPSYVFNIPLFHTHEDIGYMSTYLNFFEGGRNYYHGEYVIYNDRTYVVRLDRYVEGASNNYEYVRCGNTFFMLSDRRYVQILLAEVRENISLNVMYHGYPFILYNGIYYRFRQNIGYVPIEMTEFTCGIWNDELYVMEFDTTHMVPITEWYASENPDNEWYSRNNPYGSRFKIFEDVQSIPDVHTFDTIRVNGCFYIWDDVSEEYVYDVGNALYYTIHGTGSSQLKGFRRFRQYLNVSDITETPREGYDWLYYYRKGYVVMTNSVSRDAYGNIERWSDSAIAAGQTVEDLYAYGDVLLDITNDRVSHTITFKYVIGGHLKATVVEVGADIDGTLLYKYDNFEYDEDDEHGVVFTETYNYASQGDINDLVQSGEFDNYVCGNHDSDADYVFEKFEFSVSENTITSSVINSNGSIVDYGCLYSEYTEDVPNELDYIYQPIYKKEYLMGYSFEPYITKDVSIDRGNGAAFERHIRLGEVKTFEDLENYSFFKLSEG